MEWLTEEVVSDWGLAGKENQFRGEEQKTS